MADISVEQRSGGQKTWIWALVAIVAVIGLMAWLARESAEIGRTAAIVEADAAAAAAADDEEEAAAGTQTAELAELANNPDAYAGQTVRVLSVPVAAPLGPRAFWADIPGQNPFLVVLGTNVTGVQMPVSGQQYNLTGTVQPVTEQNIQDWATGGTISEGSRDEASFATHYLLAGTARVTQ
jgi:hypothetical protein